MLQIGVWTLKTSNSMAAGQAPGNEISYQESVLERSLWTQIVLYPLTRRANIKLGTGPDLRWNKSNKIKASLVLPKAAKI